MTETQTSRSDRSIYITLIAGTVLFAAATPAVYAVLPEPTVLAAAWMSLLGSLLVAFTGLFVAGLVSEARSSLAMQPRAAEQADDMQLPAGVEAA